MEEKKKIILLVVDDEELVYDLFKIEFRKELRADRLEILFAFSGEQAKETLRLHGQKIGLILSDIHMPGTSGLELLKWVKERYSDLPMLLMTAFDDHLHREEASNLGVDRYITKPVDFAHLKDVVLGLA